MTFTNLSPFPVTLAVRGFERLTGRDGEASEADLSVPVWPVNRAFNAALAVEAAWLRVSNLPIGTSIMAVARKEGQRTAGNLPDGHGEHTKSQRSSVG
jgi:hypothetical protein